MEHFLRILLLHGLARYCALLMRFKVCIRGLTAEPCLILFTQHFPHLFITELPLTSWGTLRCLTLVTFQLNTGYKR